MPKPYSDPLRKAWPFFALFVLVGLGLMTPFVLQAVRDYRIANLYRQTECRIEGERTVLSSSTSRLGGRWVTTEYSHKEFTWSYTVDRRQYTAEGYDNHDGIMADPQETGNISTGTRHECWYDPAKPEDSVLARNFRAKFYLGALIPGSFILIGGAFLRGAVRRKPQNVDVGVSKGDHLRVRLSPAMTTKGIAGWLGALILLLGTIIVLVLPRISEGEAWTYLICLGIEGFLIYHLVRAVRAARVPDPIVEIDDHPLGKGQTVQLYIRHPGPAQLAALQVQIVCEKIGQAGTRNAYEHRVLERNALQIATAEEFNEQFSIPAKASPSAKTVQTATAWYVRVRRKLDGKLDNGVSYDTDYAFQVVGKNGEDDAP